MSTLLRNKAYIGEARWGSSYAVAPENPTNKEKYRKMKKSSRRIKPQEEWIASSIPVPVIIDRDLFIKVRAQLKTNFDLCQRNTKNEYLLSGKIQCVCGRRRAGEGPQHGKHLYYRCTDRVLSFPLPRTCQEKGINARIADKLVWDRISVLMSSPESLQEEISRWVNARQTKVKSSGGDIGAIGKEISKLKVQEERYNKAYGAGLFTIEKLREYAEPLRNQITALQIQKEKLQQEDAQIRPFQVPNKQEIESFAHRTSGWLGNLNFEGKRIIIRGILDEAIGTQKQLQVCGSIPLTLNYGAFKSNYRHCWLA